jgi:hypothetical protein
MRVRVRCAKGPQSVLGWGNREQTEVGSGWVGGPGRARGGQARVSRGAYVCVVFDPCWAVWRRQLSLWGAPPQEGVCKAPLISEWVV